MVQNVGLVGGSVTGDNATGALVGSNYGVVNNSYATTPVTGDFYTGGLVGLNYGGTITNSHATGAVSSSGYGAGGLVGTSGTYSNYSATHISNSYATGAVTSTRAAAVGGLAGTDYGTIDNTYATGSVASTGSNPSEVGGLVGALVGPVRTPTVMQRVMCPRVLSRSADWWGWSIPSTPASARSPTATGM